MTLRCGDERFSAWRGGEGRGWEEPDRRSYEAETETESLDF